jgi:hypothetical protein
LIIFQNAQLQSDYAPIAIKNTATLFESSITKILLPNLYEKGTRDMNPEEDIDKLMLAVGAMGELGQAMFQSFKKAGFDHDDAIKMTVGIMSELLRPR